MAGKGDLNERINRGASANRGGRSTSRFQSDSEFVNLELDKEQTAEYRAWRADVEEVENRWTELVEEGYRVNTKYDNYSSSCAAFIIPGDGSDNMGFLLTGRGGTPYRAVSEAIYKHFFVLKGIWGNFAAQRNFRDDPDF